MSKGTAKALNGTAKHRYDSDDKARITVYLSETDQRAFSDLCHERRTKMSAVLANVISDMVTNKVDIDDFI